MLHWLWIPPEEQAWSIFVAVNMVKKTIHRLRHPNIIQWRRQWHPTPVLLPRKFHGQRSLVGCSSWGHHELDTIEQLHFHFPLSHTGEGNCNPLQCSCLENPRDGGAWWAAVYGIAQSRTQLKRLSIISSNIVQKKNRDGVCVGGGWGGRASKKKREEKNENVKDVQTLISGKCFY